MVGGAVDAPSRGARSAWRQVGPAVPAQTRSPGGRIFVGRAQLECGAAASLFVVIEGGEIAAVAAVARELAGGNAGAAHHPGDERTRPRLARRAPVPVGMAAASPVVADLAGERFAALGDAAAVGVAADLAAIDHGRAAEPGPFLPGGVGDTVGGCAVGQPPVRGRCRSQPRSMKQGEQDRWQPVTERVRNAGQAAASNTNIDGGESKFMYDLQEVK